MEFSRKELMAPLFFEACGKRGLGDVAAVHPEVHPDGVCSIPKGVTTLVIFNVPWDISFSTLLKFWPADGRYDYFSLLYNVKTGHNIGYAFINFTRHEYAVDFAAMWQGLRLPTSKTPRGLKVSPATHQGLQNNLARLTVDDMDKLDKAGMLPVVFLDGVRVDARFAYHKLGLGNPKILAGKDIKDIAGHNGGGDSPCAPAVNEMPWPTFAVVQLVC
mmetsp:Transcript_63358/g.147592  ORF Transcript_63358/g.147592 Transcript_63358/m.147592 type:complete len:217 (-) Transcript_63358:151-801(-)